MTPEGRVKNAVKLVLDKYEPVWYYMPVSCGFGKQGIPDFIVCANGRFLVIETKDTGKQRTALQTLCGNAIAQGMGIVLTIYPDSLHVIHSYLDMCGCHAATTK